MLDAKYAVLHGERFTNTQEKQWAEVQRLFDYFNSYDNYLFSILMWNFLIPYRLKQYIDVITQPGMAWSYTPEEGYQGLLINKKATIIFSSGDAYGEGTGFEHFDKQKPYIHLWLNFIGITAIDAVNVEATLFEDRTNREEAIQNAITLGAN